MEGGREEGKDCGMHYTYIVQVQRTTCSSACTCTYTLGSPGIKIVQQIAILMGCAVLPHLKSLVEIVENGLVDEQQKVRTITALSLAALAEAATPYGIEAFDSVLVRLWKGIRYVYES